MIPSVRYAIEDSNFTTVQMADALTAFNVVKLLRINSNLVNIPQDNNCENPNFRSRLKTRDSISCLGSRS